MVGVSGKKTEEIALIQCKSCGLPRLPPRTVMRVVGDWVSTIKTMQEHYKECLLWQDTEFAY